MAAPVPSWHPDEVVPGLSIGGTAETDETWQPAPRSVIGAPSPYDAVVTLYPWARPVGWGVEELRFGFPDLLGSDADIEAVRRCAAWAHERWHAHARVLVRCQRGLNRSALVVALALMQDGCTADAAIERIRAARSPLALSNGQFERWLRTQ